MGRGPEKNLGRRVFRDEGNDHGVKSRTFLMMWPVVGEAGCPIPSSQRTFSSSITFSPRGPQSSSCVD